MKKLAYVGIPLGLLLLFSTGLVLYSPPAFAAKTPTVITLDEVPGKVRPGDMVTFAGMLTTADGTPISQVPVKIYLLTSDPKLVEVASGVTGLEGNYEAIWNVELVAVSKAEYDVTKKVDTQVGSIFAQFGGSESYSSAKTGKSTITIEVNAIKTFVNFDKKLYKEGEAATVFIGFIDSDAVFLDPDSISATFNGMPIGESLSKKKVGSYTYVTPALKGAHNQVMVIPKKEGYNTEVEAVTITVIQKGSAGPFVFE